MTKISADELLQKISDYEQWLRNEFSFRKNINENLDAKIASISVIRALIKDLVELENRKCKKCGDIHSHVIDCSDRMTFNVNVDA